MCNNVSVFDRSISGRRRLGAARAAVLRQQHEAGSYRGRRTASVSALPREEPS